MKRRMAALLLIALSAFTLRAFVYFKDSPDSLYHLRRARFAVANFPRTVIFDPFMRYPEGAICIWPPLFDICLAIPALITAGGNASSELLERTAFWMPPIFAAGATVAAAIAGLAARKRFGILAGVFVALSPAHLQYSQYARTDQHVAETFWGFFSLAFFLLSCKPGKGVRLYEWLAGLFLAMSVLTWQGSIFWAALFAAPLIIESFYSKQSADSLLRRQLRILGLPAAVVSLLTWYWTTGFDVPFTYISFGWFQPVFLFATLAATLIVLLAARWSKFSRPYLFAAAGVLILALLPVLLAGKNFMQLTTAGVKHLAGATEGTEPGGAGFLSYPAEWLAQIVEYRPLLADEWGWPIRFLSFSFFLAPVMFVVWLLRWKRNRDSSFFISLCVWGVFVFVITLLQRRHLYYASLLSGIVAVELSVAAAQWLGRRVEGPNRHRAMRVLTFFICGAFVLPMLFQLREEYRRPYKMADDHRKALTALKQLAASDADPYDARFVQTQFAANSLPAGSVMAFWSQGHLITYYAEAPVVANNFGYNFFESLRFFFSANEEEALRIARRHRVRYVLVMDLLPIMNQYGAVLRHAPYVVNTGGRMQVTEKYFRTIESRLYDFEGQGARVGNVEIEPLKHFRLRYRSETGFQRFGRFVAKWKIFEIVGP